MVWFGRMETVWFGRMKIDWFSSVVLFSKLKLFFLGRNGLV